LPVHMPRSAPVVRPPGYRQRRPASPRSAVASVTNRPRPSGQFYSIPTEKYKSMLTARFRQSEAVGEAGQLDQAPPRPPIVGDPRTSNRSYRGSACRRTRPQYRIPRCAKPAVSLELKSKPGASVSPPMPQVRVRILENQCFRAHPRGPRLTSGGTPSCPKVPARDWSGVGGNPPLLVLAVFMQKKHGGKNNLRGTREGGRFFVRFIF